MPARRTKKPEHAELVHREPSPTHQSFSDYITSTTGHLIPVGDVALVLRLYPIFLKSDAQRAVKAAEKRKREEAAEAKRQEKLARDRERLEALEAQAAALRERMGIEAEQESKPAPVLSIVPQGSMPEGEVEQREEEADPGPSALSDDEEEEATATVLTLAQSDEEVEDESDLWDDDDDEVEDF